MTLERALFPDLLGEDARLFGLSVPRIFFAQVIARCTADNQRYALQIASRPPLIGLLVGYRGWLEIADER